MCLFSYGKSFALLDERQNGKEAGWSIARTVVSGNDGNKGCRLSSWFSGNSVRGDSKKDEHDIHFRSVDGIPLIRSSVCWGGERFIIYIAD